MDKRIIATSKTGKNGLRHADLKAGRPKVGSQARATGIVAWKGTGSFLRAFKADPMEIVTIVMEGVPPSQLKYITDRMGWPQDKFLDTLGLSRATVGRKVANGKLLTKEASSRVVGLQRIIGQVEAMVQDSGNPDGFDAPAWVGEWLERPQPALGGRTPSSFMDTAEGQQLVMQVLSQAHSGAYA